jgi:hypothetical protein
MRKKLHPVILTIAIFQIGLGVLGMCCDGLSLIGAVMLYSPDEDDMVERPTGPPQKTTKNPKNLEEGFQEGFEKGMKASNLAQAELTEKAPGYRPVAVGQELLALFLSLLMIVSGIGLLFMQSWARWLAVGYGGLSIATRCCGVGYHAAVLLPVLNDLCADLLASGNQSLVSDLWVTRFGPFLGFLLMLYPFTVIVLLVRPGINRAFRGEPAAESDDLEYRLRERESRWERDAYDRDDRDRFR